VKRFHQDVRAFPGHADSKLIGGDVDNAVAVGSYGASGATETEAWIERVVDRRRDLLLLPRVASIAGGRHNQRLRGRQTLTVTSKRSETDVHVAEKGAGRSVVGPDLRFVAEGRGGLTRNDHRLHPGGLNARRCCRNVV